MHEIPVPAEPAAPVPNRFWRGLHFSENLVITAVLAGMVLLPLLDRLLTWLFKTGIPGAIPFVQHLVLIVGMLGGALAARDGRLLALSSLTAFLKNRSKLAAAMISAVVGGTISIYLCYGSWQFALSTREAGSTLAYDIPVWWLQLFIPVGFALIALRTLWHSTRGGKARAVVFIAAAGLVWLAARPPASPASLVTPALVLLLVATLLGAPVFATLGGAAIILFWGQEAPVASLAIDHYNMVVSPLLPTLPLFTLGGYFLAEGGASRRLIRVFQALVGQFRGGSAVMTALVCAFFTSFTGASGVTILALGGLLMPVLLSARYSERDALGLLTGSGSLGLLFPPCLPLLLYAVVASNVGASITPQQIFLAGIVPGFLLVGLTAGWGILREPRTAAERPRFNVAEVRSALWEAKWELLLPVVAVVALFGGFATAVEAAAITALYGFVIETFVYRDLKLRDLPRVMTECGLLVGGVLLILGVAMGFTNFLITEQIPDKALEWVRATIQSPWVFLLALNVFLLLVGCLMDIFSAIIVVVPLIVPMAANFGINPVHLGIIFLANLELGYLTPPVGMNLFLSSYRFGKPMSEVTRSVLPMLGVLFFGVLVITYVPFLTLALPNWLAKGP